MAKPKKMTTLAEQPTLFKKKYEDSIIDQIKSRQTHELIIGLCGPLGSGVSTVGSFIEKHLESFGYEISKLKISDLIGEKIKRKEKKTISKSYSKKIRAYQKAGNNLRESYGFDLLSQLAIKKILANRHRDDKEDLTNAETTGTEVPTPKDDDTDEAQYTPIKRKSRRTATIVDSFKHPAEVELFQKVYGNMFFLFGVISSPQQRLHRLINNKEIPAEDAVELMERDKNEGLKHGQQLLKTLRHADFFIKNNKANINSIDGPLKRFIGLILGQKDITPTMHEYAMHIAESAARQSGCISRQVGAAILSKDGTIIATGRNDVPKHGGGLYSYEDGENDNRCLNHYDKACQNNRFKDIINRDLVEIMTECLDGVEVDELTEKNIISKIEAYPRIKNLLEFSRSVHAEMDAIVSVARNGCQTLKGASLYTTTYPCHHCARHIVAAGIDRVYYIEPYEKSLALVLHEDSIDFEPSDPDTVTDKVVFLHFEGVAPKNYLYLFHFEDRKKHGKLNETDLTTALPSIVQLLDTHIEYEAKVAKHLKQKINEEDIIVSINLEE